MQKTLFSFALLCAMTGFADAKVGLDDAKGTDRLQTISASQAAPITVARKGADDPAKHDARDDRRERREHRHDRRHA